MSVSVCPCVQALFKAGQGSQHFQWVCVEGFVATFPTFPALLTVEGGSGGPERKDKKILFSSFWLWGDWLVLGLLCFSFLFLVRHNWPLSALSQRWGTCPRSGRSWSNLPLFALRQRWGTCTQNGRSWSNWTLSALSQSLGSCPGNGRSWSNWQLSACRRSSTWSRSWDTCPRSGRSCGTSWSAHQAERPHIGKLPSACSWCAHTVAPSTNGQRWRSWFGARCSGTRPECSLSPTGLRSSHTPHPRTATFVSSSCGASPKQVCKCGCEGCFGCVRGWGGVWGDGEGGGNVCGWMCMHAEMTALSVAMDECVHLCGYVLYMGVCVWKG